MAPLLLNTQGLISTEKVTCISSFIHLQCKVMSIVSVVLIRNYCVSNLDFEALRDVIVGKFLYTMIS